MTWRDGDFRLWVMLETLMRLMWREFDLLPRVEGLPRWVFQNDVREVLSREILQLTLLTI